VLLIIENCFTTTFQFPLFAFVGILKLPLILSELWIETETAEISIPLRCRLTWASFAKFWPVSVNKVVVPRLPEFGLILFTTADFP